VVVRLKRLKEDGFVEELVGINLSKMGLCIAKVDITARNPAVMVLQRKQVPGVPGKRAVSG
jgi:hypothetical protein